MADSGLYYCGAVYTLSTSMGHVELKVSKKKELRQSIISNVCSFIQEERLYFLLCYIYVTDFTHKHTIGL